MNYANRKLPAKICLRLLKRRMERQSPEHLREFFMDEVDQAAWIMTMNALVDYVELHGIKDLQEELEGAFDKWTIAVAWVSISDLHKIAHRWYLRVLRALLQFIWLSTRGYSKDQFRDVVKLFAAPFSHREIEFTELRVRIDGAESGVLEYLSSLLSQAGSSLYEAI